MKNLFSYDSKLMEVLGFMADLALLNLLFLLCCIPVVTIGAAQSGLYNAVKVLQDKEDDSSVFKAFFRGFKDGFWRVTGMWLIFAALEAVLVATYWITFYHRETGMFMSFWIPFVMMIPCLILHALITPFHAKFTCSFSGLFKNVWLVMLFYPIRSLGVAALTWAPALVFVSAPTIFLDLTPVFLAIYYSVAFMFGWILMQKPYNRLVEEMENPDED